MIGHDWSYHLQLSLVELESGSIRRCTINATHNSLIQNASADHAGDRVGVCAVEIERMLIDVASESAQVVMYDFILRFLYSPWYTISAAGSAVPALCSCEVSLSAMGAACSASSRVCSYGCRCAWTLLGSCSTWAPARLRHLRAGARLPISSGSWPQFYPLSPLFRFPTSHSNK